MRKAFQAENYPIIITRDGDRYVLRVRELFLVEGDADLDAGLKRLEQRACDLIAEQTALGDAGDLPPPGGIAEDDREKRALKVFAFKAAIVALVLAVMMAAAAASFTYAMREPLRNAGVKLGRAAIAQVEKGLRQAIEKEMTPKRRERLRILVADAVPHLKPYIAELRPLIAELCPLEQ